MRATASFGVLVLCAGPWVSGCDSPFEPASYVADLTMLAASADAPTAHPGETVTVRTLIVNPAAEPIQWAYFTCVDPAEQGFLGCAHAPNGPAVVGTGSEVTPSLQIPTDTISRLPEPARASSLVGLGIVLCPGTLVLDWTNLDEVTGPARCLD